MADKFFLDTRDLATFSVKLNGLMAVVADEDDLPCVLIFTAYIDKCLLHLLKVFFVKKGEGATSRELFKAEALLDSLYNRARLSYLLGLISSQMLTTISVICKIRNDFAHSEEPLSFKSEDIIKQCKELPDYSQGIEIGTDMRVLCALFPESQLEARNSFVRAAYTIILALATLPHKLVPLNTPFSNNAQVVTPAKPANPFGLPE